LRIEDGGEAIKEFFFLAVQRRRVGEKCPLHETFTGRFANCLDNSYCRIVGTPRTHSTAAIRSTIVLPRSTVVAVGLPFVFLACLIAEDRPTRPGPTANGFVLPNGWTIMPAGRQVALTDLPLNIRPLTDGKHALVATSGYNKHELSLIELESGRILDKQEVRQSWYGLALSADEKRVWWSGGGAGILHQYDFGEEKLKRTGSEEPPPPKRGEAAKLLSFKSGLLYDTRSRSLCSLDMNAGTITAINLDENTLR
jgi:hypothetical protein